MFKPKLIKMFKLTYEAQREVEDNTPTCIALQSYLITLGLGAAVGAIGSSVVSGPISYNNAVQSGVIASAISCPILWILNYLIFGGTDSYNSYVNGTNKCDEDFYASSIKGNCCMPGSVGSIFISVIKSGILGGPLFLIGTGVKGLLITQDDITYSVIIGIVGNIFVTFGVSILIFLLRLYTGKVSWCTPSIECPECLDFFDCCPLKIASYRIYLRNIKANNVQPVEQIFSTPPLIPSNFSSKTLKQDNEITNDIERQVPCAVPCDIPSATVVT